MLQMTNENFARLLRGLTIAVGNRRNRILLYRFLAAEIRALHCSYGVGDDESYRYRSRLSVRQHRRDRRFRGGRVHGRMVHRMAARAPRTARRRVTYRAARNVIVDAAKAMDVRDVAARTP
jgi:hypothetical protein